MKSFLKYAEKLDGLLDEIEWGQRASDHSERIQESLSGQAAEVLHQTGNGTSIWKAGAYFTSPQLADLAIEPITQTPSVLRRPVCDPTCGAGDLLLRWADDLPVSRDLQSTLARWGLLLRGCDVFPEFVRVAKRRLVLKAIARGARLRTGRAPHVDKLFTGLLQGDAMNSERDETRLTLLMNPPFSSVDAGNDCEWASGKVSLAAVLFESCIKRATPKTRVVAILPDVLRTGSRYERWRASISNRVRIGRVQPKTLSSLTLTMSKLSAPNLIIVDVGHGNASVLRDTRGVVVFDTGKGPALLEFLHESGIKEVKRLVLSHADDDHIGNASRLLLDDKIRVREVYYNSDPTKDTDSQQQLQVAILTARRQRKTTAHPGLSSTISGSLDCGEVSIEVLFPPPETLVTGVGGRSVKGSRNTSNSLSAAIRLCHGGKAVVLLGGDVGMECLEFWDEEKVEPIAQIVVFPHHGGAPGTADAVRFAEGVSTRVKPELVVFSIHRTRFNLPREDVVAAILKGCPGAKFLCTQLPERIVKELKLKRSAWSLHALKAKGGRGWWDGTIEVTFDKGTGKARPYAANAKLRRTRRKL